MMGSEDKDNNKSLSDKALECILDEDQNEEIEEYENLVEAKTRMIYDLDNNILDFSKCRTTDLKNNHTYVVERTFSMTGLETLRRNSRSRVPFPISLGDMWRLVRGLIFWGRLMRSE